MDSERSQVPDSSATSYVSILDAVSRLAFLAQRIATTASSNSTVGSVKINVHRKVDGLEAGVLPYDKDEVSIMLGSTSGSFPIFPDNASPGIAEVASYASTLSRSPFFFEYSSHVLK